MSRFFDRINIVKRRREAKAQREQQQARVIAAFDAEMRALVDEKLATEDPVARYIALSALPEVFDERCRRIQEQKCSELVKRDGETMLRIMKGGGVTGLGLAVGLGLAFGPGAAAIGAMLGAAVVFGPAAAAASGDVVGAERMEAASFTAPFRACAEKHKAALKDTCARLEDEHLERFAASPEWDRLVGINPGLHRKISDAFRASVARPADAPAPKLGKAPPVPPQKGFSL